MTIFSNRDLERMAVLQANWRKELLLELVRLRKERHSDKLWDLPTPTEAATDGSRTASPPKIGLSRN